MVKLIKKTISFCQKMNKYKNKIGKEKKKGTRKKHEKNLTRSRRRERKGELGFLQLPFASESRQRHERERESLGRERKD